VIFDDAVKRPFVVVVETRCSDTGKCSQLRLRKAGKQILFISLPIKSPPLSRDLWFELDYIEAFSCVSFVGILYSSQFSGYNVLMVCAFGAEVHFSTSASCTIFYTKRFFEIL
jgi:hypothetical protein